jgi:FKBP-type peptidyl-prolyl cis-trans isomerase SlyD
MALGDIMKVGKGSVVSLEYKLHLGDGVVVDSSEAGDPLVYLHGQGQIVPGLERALEGLEMGVRTQATVAPVDGYGEADPTALQQVPRNAFPDGFEAKVGLELVAQGPDGEPLPFTIRAVYRSTRKGFGDETLFFHTDYLTERTGANVAGV